MDHCCVSEDIVNTFGDKLTVHALKQLHIFFMLFPPMTLVFTFGKSSSSELTSCHRARKRLYISCYILLNKARFCEKTQNGINTFVCTYVNRQNSKLIFLSENFTNCSSQMQVKASKELLHWKEYVLQVSYLTDVNSIFTILNIFISFLELCKS